MEVETRHTEIGAGHCEMVGQEVFGKKASRVRTGRVKSALEERKKRDVERWFKQEC